VGIVEGAAEADTLNQIFEKGVSPLDLKKTG